MALSRDSILAVNDLKKEEVQVPEWGGSVFVRTMTASERDRFEVLHVKDPAKDIRARLAVSTVCDEAGNLLFEEKDIPLVSKKSAAALDRIFSVALRLSAVSKQDVEQLAGESEPTP